MRFSSERHFPQRVHTVEGAIMGVLHEYPYRLVAGMARPTDRLLEVGFGEGYGAALVRDSVAEYVGLEVVDDAVAHAAAAYGDGKLSFVAYDGLTFPFPDDSFDLVISFQVIEHVTDLDVYLGEIRRTCRPGGTVVIVTPNRNHRLDPGERPWNRYHVTEFSPDDLERALRARFDGVELYGVYGTPTIQAIEKARVARLRRTARRDRLGLRYLLPNRLAVRVGNVMRWIHGPQRRRADGLAVADIRVEDIAHSREAVPTSLDLMAIARA